MNLFTFGRAVNATEVITNCPMPMAAFF